MNRWHPQLYLQQGLERGEAREVLDGAVLIGRKIVAVHPDLPPIFTLRHLAHLTNVEYGFLRGVVSRRLSTPYTVFSVRKASRKEFRRICVPMPDLMKVQRWIARRILRCGRPHEASFAYHVGSNIIDAARLHCRCRWLIKIDVRRFFESISEIAVFRAFLQFGYQPLVSFELARLCTMVEGKVRGDPGRWSVFGTGRTGIPVYMHRHVGHLPQGAPTSPMLANLATRDLDEKIATIAARCHLTYTRYADDICLSTQSRTFIRRTAARVVGEVYEAMACVGLSPNIAKTRVSPPGARKVVLGLNVDRERPRLSREFRDDLRQHLHFLTRADFGPARHAQERGFVSLFGLRNYVQGLIAYSGQIDAAFAAECKAMFDQIAWPL